MIGSEIAKPVRTQCRHNVFISNPLIADKRRSPPDGTGIGGRDGEAFRPADVHADDDGAEPAQGFREVPRPGYRDREPARGKDAVPMLHAEIELIQDVQRDEYWRDVTLPILEKHSKKAAPPGEVHRSRSQEDHIHRLHR